NLSSPTPAVTDADAGAVFGIAVTAADTAHGSWEYKLAGDPDWTPFPAVSGSNALLLPSDARVRFRPGTGYSNDAQPAAGRDAITFRAWDQTTGTAGGTADATTNGDPTAFSSATATSHVTVTQRAADVYVDDN